MLRNSLIVVAMLAAPALIYGAMAQTPGTPAQPMEGTGTPDRSAPTATRPLAAAQPSGMGLTQTPVGEAEVSVRRALARDGYTDVQDLAREGDTWRATAVHSGTRKSVTIGQDGKPVAVPHSH